MLRVYKRFNLLNNFPQFLLYSTSSSSSSSSSSKSSKSLSTNEISEYLVNSVGFSEQQAVSTSTKLFTCRKINRSNLSENVVSVVDLLKNHGFNNTNITKMVSLYPKLLAYDAHTTIEPKLNSLIQHGFSGTDLILIVARNPKILGFTGSKVWPVIQVLKQFLVVDAHVISVMKRPLFYSYYGVCNFLPKNVAFLTSCGVTIETIRKHLVMQPSMFASEPAVFKDIVIKAEKKLGHPMNSAMFLYGVQLFTFFGEEVIESKCPIFKSFGWTQSDINLLTVANAKCFTLSDENIKKKLEFLMNDVGLEPAHLAFNSCFFSCSLEKRLLPRHAVLKVLKEKALVKKCPRLITVLSMTESHFMTVFVLPFEDVHQVYADHIGCTVESLTEQ